MSERVVDRQLLLRAGLGLVVVLALAAATAWLLEEPITSLANGFVDRFGLGGIFAGVLFADSSPLPLSHEPIVLLGVSAENISTGNLLLTAASASVLAGPTGYCLGALLVSRSPLRRWLERRHPGFTTFMERHGVKGVAVAALLPIPFALATWSAGMMRIGLPAVAAASLLRIPKTAFYLWLILAGWRLGGG